MNRPSFLWRLVMRAERYLPRVPAATEVRPATAKRDGWVVLVALLPAMLTPLTVALSRGFAPTLRASVPLWRPVVLDLLLIAAGAALVAAVAAAVVTWRRQKDRPHA